MTALAWIASLVVAFVVGRAMGMEEVVRKIRDEGDDQ